MAMLWSDWLMWGLALLIIITLLCWRHNPQLQISWNYLCRQKMAMGALVILCCYFTVGLLDCVHFYTTQTNPTTGVRITQVESLLDWILGPLAHQSEKTYSKPFATHLYSQMLVTLPNGKEIRAYPRLKFAATQLKNPQQERLKDILWRGILGALIGVLIFSFFTSLLIAFLASKNRQHFLTQWRQIRRGDTTTAWNAVLITLFLVWIVIGSGLTLASHYHILGTNKIGQDVFYQATKSIRTGLIIGTVTTLCMMPLALMLGTMAGYFGRWVDDLIQYLYTTLSSIPGVLFISASILVLQIYIANHPTLFSSLRERADARLLALCFILGITSWASLCRLLRGETLKLREQDFIAAAQSLGAKHRTILLHHIIPNVMHIVIITVVIDFSSLVLAEAVLSYVGVGVDPTMMSWGNMINSARLELAREPTVWWPLLASLIFMFLLVLSMNVFADNVRDALDPRLREL